MKETGKRKEWVKNVAIIFLAVLLVLTFFSNTIKNYSLPEVAAQYTSSGTITNKIRGNGTVEASDPYSVVYKAERKVASVKVSVGDTVEKGDVLYELEEGESEALKVARQTLSELEAAYEKSLILGSVSKDLTSKVENGQMGSASELQDKVNAAKKKAENAKAYVEQLQREQQAAGSSTSNSANDELDKQIANIKTIREACVERRDANIGAVSKSADEYRKALDLEYGTPDASTGEPEAKNTYPRVIWLCLRSLESDITLTDDEKNSIVVVKYDFIQKHGSSLDAYLSAMNLIKDLSKKVPNILTDTITIGGSTTTYTDRILNDPVLNQRRKAYEDAQVSVNTENQNIVNIDNQITIWEGQKTTTSTTNDYTTKIADAQAAYEKAQKTYDDLVSEINTSYDLLGQLSKIEAQKEVVRELESDQGNSEITAPVSGTVLSINYVAGETINQGSTVSTIQVAGKGFTMSVTIPAEKARLIDRKSVV